MQQFDSVIRNYLHFIILKCRKLLLYYLICGGSLAPCSVLLLELVYIVLCSQKDRTLFPLN